MTSNHLNSSKKILKKFCTKMQKIINDIKSLPKKENEIVINKGLLC